MSLQNLIRNKKRYGGIGTGGRKSIWKRDGHVCRMCKCKVIDDRKAGGHAGEVHHLNRDSSDKRMLNKILLCRSCHSRLHQLSETDYVKRIMQITGMETEVITDKKTFKIWNMAESGASLDELCKTANYSEETVSRLLEGIFPVEQLWGEDKKAEESKVDIK